MNFFNHSVFHNNYFYISKGITPKKFDWFAEIMSNRSPSQSPSRHITVVDVYDLAASIGKDFERIIDLFGSDSVRQIMPKVIFKLLSLFSTLLSCFALSLV